jgi:hypothetical protein
MTTKDRIGELYPGEENKSVRAKLYRIPDFLKFDQPDDEIHREAANCGAAKPEPKALEGEVVAGDDQQISKDIALLPKGLVIVTADDYEKASLQFASGMRIKKQIEANRKAMTAPILAAKKNIDDLAKARTAELDAVLDPIKVAMTAFKVAERDMLRDQEAERQRILDVEKTRLMAEADAAKAILVESQKEETAKAEDPFLAALDDDYAPSVVSDRVAAVEEALRAVALVGVRTVLPEMQAPVTATGSRVSYPWKIIILDPNLVPRHLCTPDPSLLIAEARRLKDEVGDIRNVNPGDYPGCKVVENVSIGSR